MWIKFSACRPFAIRVYVGGVNAVSGETKRNGRNQGSSVQDYVVAPLQKWLDGIARDDGKVSQFVAAAVGSGYSVEAQVNGDDNIGGVQIEVIPRKFAPINLGQPPFGGGIWVKTLTGKMIGINVSMDDTVEDVKDEVYSISGVPANQQRLVYKGKQLEDGMSLISYFSDTSLTTVDF